MYIPTPTAHGLQKQEYSRPGGQDRRDEILLGVHFLSLCLIGGKTGICNGQLGISVSILGTYAAQNDFYFRKILPIRFDSKSFLHATWKTYAIFVYHLKRFRNRIIYLMLKTYF